MPMVKVGQNWFDKPEVHPHGQEALTMAFKSKAFKYQGVEAYETPEEHTSQTSFKDRGLIFLNLMVDFLKDPDADKLKVGVGVNKRWNKDGTANPVSPAIGVSFDNLEPILFTVVEVEYIILFLEEFHKEHPEYQEAWEEQITGLIECMRFGIGQANALDLVKLEDEMKDYKPPNATTS